MKSTNIKILMKKAQHNQNHNIFHISLYVYIVKIYSTFIGKKPREKAYAGMTFSIKFIRCRKYL